MIFYNHAATTPCGKAFVVESKPDVRQIGSYTIISHLSQQIISEPLVVISAGTPMDHVQVQAFIHAFQ